MQKEKITIILAFIAIYIIWGSTYLFNKMLLDFYPPFQLSGIRFASAGILVFILAFIRGWNLRISQKMAWNTIFAGLLFLALGNGFLVWGLKYVESGFAALLIASQPMILLFMLWIWKGQKIQLKSWMGVILGLIGIYLLIHAQGEGIKAGWKGILLISISLLCWGYASIYVGSASLPKNSFINTAYQMFSAGIIMLGISFFRGEDMVNPLLMDLKTWGQMGFQIIFGSIIAFSSFNYLLVKVSPEKVATSTYVNPLVAVVLGYFVLSEKMNWNIALAAIVLLMGVYFINSAKSERRKM